MDKYSKLKLVLQIKIINLQNHLFEPTSTVQVQITLLLQSSSSYILLKASVRRTECHITPLNCSASQDNTDKYLWLEGDFGMRDRWT
jgi:hypothetical protein